MVRDDLHVGRLVDTDLGPMFACRRCQRLLDQFGWARDCSAPPNSRAPRIAAAPSGSRVPEGRDPRGGERGA